MLTLLFSLRDCFRARAVLQAEILALRHQLLILHRSSRERRLRLRWTDRLLWVWLSRLWNDWRSALLIVKPETVIAWHRKGFRLYWTWKSRCCAGRHSISAEVRNLIHQMSLANPRWGAPRIHGELLKIGIEVSQATVAKYMVRKKTTLPVVADLPSESRQGLGLRGLLRGAHHHVPTPIRLRDSRS
jgi:putative transposase